MNDDPLKATGMHGGASPRVFQNAAKLRDTMTDAEKVLWEYLRKKPGGLKFRRQHPIAGYVLDFYCHKLRLCIEVDGGYHMTKEQREKDADRTNYLRSIGIDEIRFTNEQVLTDLENVIAMINDVARAGSPSGDGVRAGNTPPQ